MGREERGKRGKQKERKDEMRRGEARRGARERENVRKDRGPTGVNDKRCVPPGYSIDETGNSEEQQRLHVRSAFVGSSIETFQNG
jgi:hypothetical protein